MDIQRKPVSQSASGHDNGTRHVVTVDLPPPYEGIGNALRASYQPARADLPSDMLDLLGQLNRM